jgi:hypothetical protein
MLLEILFNNNKRDRDLPNYKIFRDYINSKINTSNIPFNGGFSWRDSIKEKLRKNVYVKSLFFLLR